MLERGTLPTARANSVVLPRTASVSRASMRVRVRPPKLSEAVHDIGLNASHNESTAGHQPRGCSFLADAPAMNSPTTTSNSETHNAGITKVPWRR